MKYVDTRNGKILSINSYGAILSGKIKDGLITPIEKIKPLTKEEFKKLQKLNFADLATEVLSRFFSDIPKKEIAIYAKKAYSKHNFDNQEKILPIYDYKNEIFSIEQWHGKTAAFKDIALSILPFFIEKALKIENKKTEKNKKILMLGATSGDTGSAGQAGFQDIKNAYVSILYPEKGKVTYVQKEQMNNFQTDEGRISAYSILDNFDFCQTKIAKPLLDDKNFRNKLLKKYSITLSSLNSINIGRIAPQIISFFQLYRKINKKFDVCVPTGNFGHILSAFFAKKMGVPIRKLIIATNINDVLHRFCQTGEYNPKKFQTTYSPSMDIAISSNIERVLFYLSGNDHKKVNKWMNDLKNKGKFKLDKKTFTEFRKYFDSGTVSETETLAQIKKTWKNHKRILDPHTAVAQVIAEQKKEKGVPMAFCETAHWGKFVQTISTALGVKTPSKKPGEWELEGIKKINQMIKEKKGTPRSTKWLNMLKQGNKKAKKTGIRPSTDEMKSYIFEQIEGTM